MGSTVKLGWHLDVMATSPHPSSEQEDGTGEGSLSSPVLYLVGFWIVVVDETLNSCTPHTLMVGGCFVKGDMTEPDRDR